jgi:hypothetical protein
VIVCRTTIPSKECIMDQFVQHMLYDYLGKRTIKLESDKIVIDSKNMLRTLTDDYPYSKIDPEFKTIRRGEKEWGGIVYGLIISILLLLFFQKIFHNGLFTIIVYCIELCAIATAVYLVSLGYFKRRFIFVLDTSGNCIFSLKETVQSKEFIKKLKERTEKSKP